MAKNSMKNYTIKGIWSDSINDNIFENSLENKKDLQLDLFNLSQGMDHYSLVNVRSKEKKGRNHKVRDLHQNKNDNVVGFQYFGHLNPAMSFDNYIVSSTNETAKNAVEEFLKTSNTDFCLMYLNGSSGVGKTHLIQAIGNQLFKEKSSFYLSSAFWAFAEENNVNHLKNYNYILIDDLEDLDSRLDMQKVLCELLDLGVAKKLKVIMTGSKKLSALKSLDPRLQQKLAAAISFEIKPMDQNLAQEYIDKVLRELSHHDFLLTETKRQKLLALNPLTSYQLAGELSKIASLKKFNLQEEELITPNEDIELLAQDSFLDYEKKIIEEILDFVAGEFGVEKEKLLSHRREKEFSGPRHVAMYVFKEKLGLSYNQIGKIFQKDHSTVIYAVDKVRKKLGTDRSLKEQIGKMLK